MTARKVSWLIAKHKRAVPDQGQAQQYRVHQYLQLMLRTILVESKRRTLITLRIM